MLNSFPLYPFDWWDRVGLNYPAVVSFALFWCFALGACLGSFLNVCIWRMPRGESISRAPSHCTTCGNEIRWFDNLPIISYLLLRGRCRNCRAPYSPRYLTVEVLTGTLFVLLFIKIGAAGQPPQTIAAYWIMTLLTISGAWIDAEHRIIPDALNYPAMILGLTAAFLLPQAWGTGSHIAALLQSLVSGLIPGAFLAAFAWCGERLAGREAIGRGDIKFIAATGMLIGLPGAFFTLLAGSFAGSVYGMFAAGIAGRSPRQTSIAFGPFLAGGSIVWMLFGQWIWNGYMLLSLH